MYQNDPQKVLTNEVRLSYVELTTPRAAKPGAAPKYSAVILLPKSDAATKADIDASIQAAINNSLTKQWGGVMPPNLSIPMYDGDGVMPNTGVPFGEECRGHWVIRTKSNNKPQVVGIDNINTELLPSDIYSGMYARVTFRCFGFSNDGNRGVSFGLGNVLKTRDGESLSGSASAVSDFANVAPSAPAAPIPGYATPAPQAYATPAAPVPAYHPQQTAPLQGYAAPPAAPPWAPANNGIDPLTGLPM